MTMPLSSDQSYNAALAQDRGMGVAVNTRTSAGLEERLRQALQTVLGEEQYRTGALRLSRLMRARQHSPAEVAAGALASLYWLCT